MEKNTETKIGKDKSDNLTNNLKHVFKLETDGEGGRSLPKQILAVGSRLHHK